MDVFKNAALHESKDKLSYCAHRSEVNQAKAQVVKAMLNVCKNY